MKDFFKFEGQDNVDDVSTDNYDNEAAIEEVDVHVEETPVLEYIPVTEKVASTFTSSSSVTIYSLRDFVIPGVGPIKKGYNTVSSLDHEKLKHIKAIRLARPDEIARRQK